MAKGEELNCIESGPALGRSDCLYDMDDDGVTLEDDNSEMEANVDPIEKLMGAEPNKMFKQKSMSTTAKLRRKTILLLLCERSLDIRR